MLKYAKMNIPGVELRNDEIIFHNGQTEEEIQQIENDYAWNLLRKKRDQLLAQSDWTQSRDVQLSNDAEWQAYRQALRDLPANSSPALDEFGNLINVEWPEEPA